MVKPKKKSTDEERRRLLEAAKAGGRDSIVRIMEEVGSEVSDEFLPAVRELARKPEIRDALGNMAVQAEASWIAAVSENVLLREAANAKMDAMTKELGGECPTALERLLIHRILLCWLQLHYVDILCAQRVKGSISLEAVRRYQNWLDSAQKRYLSAIKTLALIRKLGVPAIQVNIAEKQINTMSAGAPMEPSNLETGD